MAAMSNFSAGLPSEVLVRIFDQLSTADRRGHQRENLDPDPTPHIRLPGRDSLGPVDALHATTSMRSRAQHVPRVCRQWRDVMRGSGVWRALELPSQLMDWPRANNFFAFCLRTRGVEVSARRS